MKFYRYEDMAFTDGPHIIEMVFHLVKETPQGYWIHDRPNYRKEDLDFFGPRYKPRWVSKTSRKRYAYPTKEEAMASFKARKLRQFAILAHKLNDIRLMMESVGEGESLKRFEADLEMGIRLSYRKGHFL